MTHDAERIAQRHALRSLDARFDVTRRSGKRHAIVQWQCRRHFMRELLDREQLHIEHQRGIRWDDAAGAVRAVGELWRNDEAALPAHLHARDALIPARNHLTAAERK